MRVFDVISSSSIAKDLSFDDDDVKVYSITVNELNTPAGDTLVFSCSCPGFVYRQTCKHVDIVRDVVLNDAVCLDFVRERKLGDLEGFTVKHKNSYDYKLETFNLDELF